MFFFPFFFLLGRGKGQDKFFGFCPVFNLNSRRNGTQHFSWKWDYIITDFIVRKFFPPWYSDHMFTWVLYPTFPNNNSIYLLTLLIQFILVLVCFKKTNFPFKYESLEIPFSCLPSNTVEWHNSIQIFYCMREKIPEIALGHTYISNGKALFPMNPVSTVTFI